MKVGVLSYQGSVAEHIAALRRIDNVEPIEVKYLPALESVDRLIIPGGESTTISKLLKLFGLFEPLKKRIEQGMPVWGTCAGMILLAKKIVGEDAHLGVMDITVRRNAYGTQLDSFSEEAVIKKISAKPIETVYIRAPWIDEAGKGVDILLRRGEQITAVREKNMLATSFHPELTDDLSVLKYFLAM